MNCYFYYLIYIKLWYNYFKCVISLLPKLNHYGSWRNWLHLIGYFTQVEDKGDYPSVDAMHNISIEHSMDCILDEPKVVIDVTQPPDTVKHVHQWLKYVQGKDIKSGLLKEESYAIMDIWDFAGQHLYYASHPIFLHWQHSETKLDKEIYPDDWKADRKI